MIRNMAFLHLKLSSKTNVTSAVIRDFLVVQESFHIQEYMNLLQGQVIHNETASSIIYHIATYDNGYFKPDKCNAYEPIKEPFIAHEVTTYTRWLSQPGGAFFFTKRKPFTMHGSVENQAFAPVFEGNTFLKPIVPEPTYYTELDMQIASKALQDRGLAFFYQFTSQLALLLTPCVGYLNTNDSVIVEYTKAWSFKLFGNTRLKASTGKRSMLDKYIVVCVANKVFFIGAQGARMKFVK